MIYELNCLVINNKNNGESLQSRSFDFVCCETSSSLTKGLIIQMQV